MFLIILQCEFEGIENACRNCVERRQNCGPKLTARLWKLRRKNEGSLNLRGPKCAYTSSYHDHQTDANDDASGTIVLLHQVSQPPQDILTPFEAIHIHSLRCEEGLFRFANLQIPRKDGHRLWEIVFRRFEPNLSSKPVRYGYILYSLYKHNSEFYSDECHLTYLNRFYTATQEAIIQKDVASLVYGCFATCMYSIRTGRDLLEVESHARGFLTSVSHFVSSDILETEELYLVNCMMEKMVWEVTKRFLFTTHSTTELDKLMEFLDLFRTLDLEEDTPSWIRESSPELNLKLKFVQTIIQLHRYGSGLKELETLKELLLKCFHRDFATPIHASDYLTHSDMFDLRSLLRILWSRIFDLILSLVLRVESEDIAFVDNTVTIILTILSVVPLIPEPENSEQELSQLSNLRHIATCSIMLSGLVANEFPTDHRFGIFLCASKSNENSF